MQKPKIKAKPIIREWKYARGYDDVLESFISQLCNDPASELFCFMR